MANKFDPDTFLSDHEPPPVPSEAAFDPDAFLAAHEVRTVPPADPYATQRRIDAGMLPIMKPSLADELGKSWRELNDSTTAGIRSGADVLSGGVEPKLAEYLGRSPTGQALGFPRPGTYAQSAADHPVAATVGGLAGGLAAGAGIVGKAASAVGRGVAGAAEHIAPRLPEAARAGIEAAGAGAAYSGADTALRGGSPREILESLPEGAAGGLAMSALPSLANRTENFLTKRVVANDLRPIKQMSKKGTLDKELIQFGNGDPEEGARKMAEFVQRENLGPILRQKGASAVNGFETAKAAVWEQDLKPIYEHAKAVEPDASVPFDEIASRLRANIRKKGGNEHRLVEKAIDEIKARTELVSKSGDIPLETLLTNARDFQSAGHAGVVNVDAPPESKVVMRQVGHSLRTMANERVAAIYNRHPEAAQALFTGEQPNSPDMTYRDQPSTPDFVRADAYPNDWARRYTNAQEFAQDIPRKLADGNKRFSDYAKLEPLVRQASVLKAGEKKYGMINLIGHGLSDTAAGVAGYRVGGVSGAIGGALALEGARAAYPYAIRGGQSLAAGLAGAPVGAPAGIAGALALKPLVDRQRD